MARDARRETTRHSGRKHATMPNAVEGGASHERANHAGEIELDRN
jgi:hypothetical protein